MQSGIFIYRDGVTTKLVAQAQKAACGAANILIEGAPGTGKAALARFIHDHAGRDGDLVSVHCAAGDDPSEALAAHGERGGTLLLHDVAELSASAQAELAMALRGATGAWIIAASARSLSAAVEAGAFRADLYYRLAVVTLSLPPLADRPRDVPALAMHFAARFAQAYGLPTRGIAADARDMLAAYRWPGNVRELENVVQRAVLFAEGDEIRAADIDLAAAPAGEGDARSAALVGRTVADVERELILETLRHCGGNRTQAADILGISVRTLRNKIRQYHEEGAEVPAFSRAA
jgi:DNA-binding NtrC family response regulator